MLLETSCPTHIKLNANISRIANIKAIKDELCLLKVMRGTFACSVS